MKKRTLEKTVDILIVITGIISLLFLFGVIEAESVSFEPLNQVMTILTIIAMIYYLIEWMWIRSKKEGVFFALIKYILITSVTFCTIFGWIFMTPFYALEADNVQIAYIFLHIVIPLEIILEWIVSEKGHFRRKFITPYMFLVVVYLVSVILLASFTGISCPYAFLDPEQLGYKIVLEESILLTVVLFFYAKGILWIDHAFRKKRKKKML